LLNELHAPTTLTETRRTLDTAISDAKDRPRSGTSGDSIPGPKSHSEPEARGLSPARQFRVTETTCGAWGSSKLASRPSSSVFSLQERNALPSCKSWAIPQARRRCPAEIESPTNGIFSGSGGSPTAGSRAVAGRGGPVPWPFSDSNGRPAPARSLEDDTPFHRLESHSSVGSLRRGPFQGSNRSLAAERRSATANPAVIVFGGWRFAQTSNAMSAHGKRI
jgi:hypothetical protein